MPPVVGQVIRRTDTEDSTTVECLVLAVETTPELRVVHQTPRGDVETTRPAQVRALFLTAEGVNALVVEEWPLRDGRYLYELVR